MIVNFGMHLLRSGAGWVMVALHVHHKCVNVARASAQSGAKPGIDATERLRVLLRRSRLALNGVRKNMTVKDGQVNLPIIRIWRKK